MSRFYTLELSRFLLASWVLFFHFSLIVNTVEIKDPAPESLFFNQFVPLGFHAVPIFWVISGIVITHRYSTVFELKAFFVSRVARLVPLHYLTLLLVLVFQILNRKIAGRDEIYQCCNDTRHFLLHLLMIHGLGFEESYAFNGPSWSISAELLAFIVFALVRSKRAMNIQCSFQVFVIFYFSTVLVVGVSLLYNIDPHRFSRSFASICAFFLGSLVYSSIQYRSFKALFFALIITVIPTMLSAVDDDIGLVFGMNSFLQFPIFILILSFLMWHEFNSNLGRVGNSTLTMRILDSLGKLSFPIYMLHIPISLVLIAFSHYLKVTWSFQTLMTVYFASTCIASYFVNIFYEEPLRKWIVRLV